MPLYGHEINTQTNPLKDAPRMDDQLGQGIYRARGAAQGETGEAATAAGVGFEMVESAYPATITKLPPTAR